jgi:hypothetical protein
MNNNKTLVVSLLLSMITVSAAHAELKFKCNSLPGSAGTEQTIQFDQSKIEVTSEDRANGIAFSGLIDRSYRTRPQYAGSVRYKDPTGGIFDAILDSKLSIGRPGLLVIEYRDTDYTYYTYYCHP